MDGGWLGGVAAGENEGGIGVSDVSSIEVRLDLT